MIDLHHLVMAAIEPRVLTYENFLALQTTSSGGEDCTLFQSFKKMTVDFDRWLRTNPERISFTRFARANNYEINTKNKSLYVFLFLRRDPVLMRMWEMDDHFCFKRVTTNSFLRVTYPGNTKQEKDVWRKEHLKNLLSLPHGKRIDSRATASRLIKMLSEGVISNYNEADMYTKLQLPQDELPDYVKSVCLNHLGNTISDEYELENFAIVYTMKHKRA